MSFIEKLDYLISQKGTTRNQVFKELKIAKNSYVNWSNRGTLPGGETLIALASYFNVSTDYLLGLDKTPNRKLESELDLTEAERECLNKFQFLTEKDQWKEIGRMEVIYEGYTPEVKEAAS